MAVVCMGCRAEVSEWAARCPHCRRSLDDAELVPEPEPPAVTKVVAPPEPVAASPEPIAPAARENLPPSMPRRPAPTTRTKVSLIALVAVLVAAGVLIANRIDKPLSPAAAAAKASGLPKALASERLFFAEPGRTGLYLADGVRVRTYPATAGVGYVAPLINNGAVIYVHSGHAFRAGGGGADPPMNLGVANAIFPADGGGVGIESAGPGRSATVTYITAAGLTPGVLGGGTSAAYYDTLAAGSDVVAQVPKGLLVETPAAFSDPIPLISALVLSLVETHTSLVLGAATALIGVHRASAAWTTCPSPQSSNCALHVEDTTTGPIRTIGPPAGYNGYAQSGGGFSPNGTMLAAFVPTMRPDEAVMLHLVVVQLATGKTSVVGPGLPANALLGGTATWSADGHWLYFGGASGPLHAEAIGPGGPLGHSWTLPLATSTAVTGD